MKVEKKELENSQVELTIEVSLEELQPHLEKAAEHLSTEIKFDGFRPGKAPYDIVKAKVGEQAIYEEALTSAVNKSLVQIITDDKIMTVGQPDIQVVKLAAGNPLTYKATLGILPTLTLPNLTTIKVKKNKVTVEKEEVDKIIDELREMNIKETSVDRAIKEGDKAEIGLEIKREGVVIEGGNIPKYPIILGKKNFIPGFEEQIIGLKAKDEKTFKLTFPEKYFEKSLAGQEAEFTVKVLEVWDRQLPEANDELAKTLGGEFKTLAELKEKIKENVMVEKQAKEEQRTEQEMLEKIIEGTKYSGLPPTLVHSEQHTMLHELEDAIEHEGMKMDDYLTHVKKNKEEIEKEFLPQAEKRVKISLALRELAIKENLDILDVELDAEVDNTIKMYPNNPQVAEQVKRPEYRDYLRTILRNRKAIEFIKRNVKVE